MFTRIDRAVGRRRREAGVSTAGILAVLFLGATIGLRTTPPVWPTAVARVQPFVETIVETGTVTAQQMKVYSSTIPGAAAKIAEIAPQGQAVRRGDLLVRFDATQFERTRESERAALGQAEAELTRAMEDARLETLRAQADLEAAGQHIERAERAVANDAQGKGQLAVVEVEAALAEADRELIRARTNVADLKPLLSESFITRAEFERAEQASQRAEDQKRLAAARHDSLVKYERPAATSRALSDLSSAREGLAREGETVTARAAQRRAAVMAARSRAGEIQSRISLLTEQIERATIRAEGPGLVVYQDLYFGNDRRKPQVGDEVFPNQAIIALPDSSQFVVETRIREIDLHKVKARQRAIVRVDAYPDLRLPATVALIGALAQEDTARAGTKFFPLIATLLSADSQLRTGMTARVEIEVSSLPAAIVVPSQAVFDHDGSRYVVVARNGRAERRAVTLVAENESFAAIATGVAAGEAVLLVDPTSR
jgi:multidrug resistance efflux pump